MEILSSAGLDSFRRVIDPNDNATGGGTASALAGGMAAALIGMVARLSRGKNLGEPDSYYQAIATEGERLATDLMQGAEDDARAFDVVLAGYKLPKETAEDKATRSKAIQSAMLGAAQAPLQNARRASRVLELWRMIQGRSNPNAASDLECAGHLARAAVLGCVANVNANLSSLKDKEQAESLMRQAQELVSAAKGGYE